MAKGFRFQLDVPRHQDYSISDTAHSLWLKWNESKDDGDWETFADYVSDEIADQMEFYIEEAEPIG